MPFLSNWPLLKRSSLAPFRRSLTAIRVNLGVNAPQALKSLFKLQVFDIIAILIQAVIVMPTLVNLITIGSGVEIK
jgi:hypothetical protein